MLNLANCSIINAIPDGSMQFQRLQLVNHPHLHHYLRIKPKVSQKQVKTSVANEGLNKRAFQLVVIAGRTLYSLMMRKAAKKSD